MTFFIAISVLLTALALAWLLRPLLWPSSRQSVSSERLNASIYRDQLEALERDVARGVLTAADYEASRDELQLRLLDDTQEPPTQAPALAPGFFNARRTAAAIALVLPLGAAGTYWWLGSPQAIDPVVAHQATDDKLMQMVEALAARLKAKPDDPKGWAMLARSYKVMGRFPEAEEAFVKAGDVVNTDPNLLVDYADLLAVRAKNNIEGRPLALVNKALGLDPMHPMGLMMSGVAAFRRSDFALAVTQWEKLLSVLEPGSPDAQQVQADIAEARSKGGLPAPAPSAQAGTAQGGTAQGGAAKPEVGKLPPVAPGAAEAMTPEKINQMVDGLAAKLKANPGDLPGWVRLANAYRVQGRLAEAEEAFGKAGKLVEGDADLLTQYADLLATRAGNIEGRPLALVNKALALNPKHPVALMMSATAAYKRADYAKAVATWEIALTVLDPASRDAAMVKAEIADARVKGGLALAPAAKTKP